jgi:hypothetical protein
MKLVRHFEQKTIKTSSAEEFDILMNSIYKTAVRGGKEPEVHYFEGMGFCASVKYFVAKDIPETLAEEYELRGQGEVCDACPYFTPPKDKRFKTSLCQRTNRKTCYDSSACDIFYKEFREARNEN